MNGWTTASGSSSTLGLDPGRRRVDDRDAREHVRAVDPVAERGGRGRELDARVHALGLGRVGGDVRDDTLAALDEVANGVGEVELALGVVRLEPLERRPEHLGAEDVDRGVALARARAAPASRRRPRRSPGRSPSAVADDAAVGADVGGLEGEHGRGGLLAPVRRDELLRAAPRSSSGVSPERTSTLSAPLSDGLAGRADGVAGAERAAPGRRPPRRRTRRGVSGEATTTSGVGPSGRAASSTQSTMRRPRIGCRCFGMAERMRVPSPPAITTAAR